MSTAKTFHTLSEFLLQAGTEYFVIDISRTRRFIDNQTFFDFELNKAPFDAPRQGHAWCCIVFWNKQLSTEHYMWFLKIPLDEQALFVQAARDQFLHIVMEALGQDLKKVGSAQTNLPDNPFIFTPSQQQLADCNASIRQRLGMPKRDGYYAALRYIKAPGVQQWNDLSVQDMSDLAMSIHDNEVSEALVQNLEILPQPVCLCLFSSFEGIKLPSHVSQSLLSYHQRCSGQLAPMVLRALASSSSSEIDAYLHRLLNQASEQDANNANSHLDTETLVVIAGRHWQCLSPVHGASNTVLRQYFLAVASADPSFALFRGIFADMVQLPSLRVFLLAMIRESAHQEPLKSAIDSLIERGA